MANGKKLRVFPFVKLQTVIMALVGLIAGIIYSFGGLIIDVLVSIGWVSSASASTPGLSFGTVLAFGALIGMPLIFATYGFIVGLSEASVYNVVAGRIAGRDDRGNSRTDPSWTFWGVNIVGGAIVGAIVGAIIGGLDDGIEPIFGGGFYGAFIGGFFGSVLGIVRHHRNQAH